MSKHNNALFTLPAQQALFYNSITKVEGILSNGRKKMNNRVISNSNFLVEPAGTEHVRFVC